jgi:hypothetical protein
VSRIGRRRRRYGQTLLVERTQDGLGFFAGDLGLLTRSLQRVFGFESSLLDSPRYGCRLNEAFSSRTVQTGQHAPRSVEQLHWTPNDLLASEGERKEEGGRER